MGLFSLCTQKVIGHFALTVLLVIVVVATPIRAQTSGDNGSHDPSRMIACEGKFYIYSTGGGGKSSPDGLVWTNLPSSPPWNLALLPNNQRIWAPDGIRLNGQYYLYGSMWSSDKSSAIILTTSPSLNPASPNYKFTDQGVAISGPKGVTHSCIDPATILDKDGNLWICWGGGYPFGSGENSIFVTRMDNKTGLPVTTDPGWKPPNSPGYAIAQGHREGSCIFYHSGYYYFWWQTGGCCSGTASTYTMHVSRASAISGPYSGERVFFAGSGNIHGPGHIGIYSCGGTDWFSYHYYPDNGSVIGVNSLKWGSDGWPTNGGQVTSRVTMCDTAGGVGTIGKATVNAVKESIQLRKTAKGYDFLIPKTMQNATGELFDVQGKKVFEMKTTSGWNALPGTMLAPGINVVRVSSEGYSASALIVNNR